MEAEKSVKIGNFIRKLSAVQPGALEYQPSLMEAYDNSRLQKNNNYEKALQVYANSEDPSSGK
jgi:hypothetical protein